MKIVRGGAGSGGARIERVSRLDRPAHPLVAWGIVLAAGLLLAPAAAQEVAPFALVDLDGRPTRLLAPETKAVALIFLSPECPVSNSYAAALNELAKTHAPRGVQVVGICVTDDSPVQVRRWAQEYQLAFPIFLDPQRSAIDALGARATPEAFLLDARGKLCYRGRIDDAYAARLQRKARVTTFDLRNAIEDVVAGRAVRTPRTEAVGCPLARPTARAVPEDSPRYHRDVAPILRKHCQVCHQPGEIGPFPLVTYREAARWAADIKEFVQARRMPPWPPAAGVPLRDERRLSAGEIATLAAWADAGAPEGLAQEAPPTPSVAGWRRGTPDLVLEPAAAFQLGPTGSDIFRCFAIPTGLTEDKWVVGYEVQPGDRRVVHHVLNFFDATGTARTLERNFKEEAGDRGPGYTVAMGVGFLPDDTTRFGDLGGWAPGQAPQFLPRGSGWRLPKGADFVMQVHYHRADRPATDRTRIGLYFAREPVEQPWQTIYVSGLRRFQFLPAGERHIVARGTTRLQADCVLHSVLPHMHLLGKSVKVYLTPPGGRPQQLLDIPRWDYRWQETYWFQEPIRAAAGTELAVEGVFDNSADNPNNPNRPPRLVLYGEQATNEMLYVYFGATSVRRPWEQIRFQPSLPRVETERLHNGD